MTDKEQRIVDGVDVSSCPACNLNCGIPQCSEFFKHFPSSIYCRDNPNCLFKQLARKTQEYKTCHTELVSVSDQLKKKTQECEDLRQMYKSMVELCEAKDEAILDKQADIDELSHHCFEYSDRIHCYRKALEEIEEIVNETCIDSQSDCKSCNFSCEHKDILDIINKAKGEE